MARWERRRISLAAAVLLCCLALLGGLFFWPSRLECWADDGQAEPAGRAIDVYTDKEPYAGRGSGKSSDAFEPQEEVVLHGLVTYNKDPVPSKIVAFEVHGPVNSVENITFSLSNMTDDNGLADISFIVPWPGPNVRPKAAIFGVWIVGAAVDVGGVVVNDTLSFRVGWVIELLYVEAVDVGNAPRSTFSRAEEVAFRVGVRNIALTEKTVTLVVTASDELNVSIGTVKLDNEVVPPGEKELFVKGIVIPRSAFIGQARAEAMALKAVGAGVFVPWCPSVGTTFLIGILHDVAVLNVTPSIKETLPYQVVNITVVVKNKGQADESFSVNAYYNSTLISTLRVEDLAPSAERTLVFPWLVGNIQPGDYRMKAEAGPVAGETLLDDNTLVDDVVKVKPLPGPPTPISDTRWLLAALFLLVVLVAALIVLVVILLVFCRKRKKEEKEEPKREAEESVVQPLPSTKKCRACGKEFHAVYTFCPYCTTFHGRDFK